MDLSQNVKAVRERIAAAAAAAGRRPEEVALCAATKTQANESIRAAIAAGIQVCGENRVQELSAHLESNAYVGARVHFIGRLQTNKVRQVVGRVDLIQSVDSPRLLQAVEAQAEKLGVVQDILLEVNIAGEESKGGCLPRDLSALAELASSRMSWTIPSLSAWALMAWRSRGEPTEWIRDTLPTTCFTLLVWRWPMKWTSAPA